jgi:hypothetical protein
MLVESGRALFPKPPLGRCHLTHDELSRRDLLLHLPQTLLALVFLSFAVCLTHATTHPQNAAFVSMRTYVRITAQPPERSNAGRYGWLRTPLASSRICRWRMRYSSCISTSSEALRRLSRQRGGGSCVISARYAEPAGRGEGHGEPGEGELDAGGLLLGQ